ncbi:uncharacterized protein FA14DRAFT_161397 [Meira miltonrushii]|uniref:2-dehydropantoate 2-reductase n=1 Tax=Meira miltonrushii TaxID=1280837 RepID=A0A316VBL2_9BASI|nr:uncharacterized protein FA14DRAFT_161397 [Meira miltonrushii]PWN33643.1 hypothetical protein FA14DRAFT_161397 [Meira miltonrushii]
MLRRLPKTISQARAACFPNLSRRYFHDTVSRTGMNVHVLGAGSSGCLLAYHLQRARESLPNYSYEKLNLQLRTPPSDGQRTATVRVYNDDETLHGECELPYETPQKHSEDPIDVLFVCTKADQTINALKPLLPRLTSLHRCGPPTIVLTQNGMGLDDALVEEFGWEGNGENVPFLVSGINRHGSYLLKRFETVHAGQASIPFALSPITEARIGQDTGIKLAGLANRQDGTIHAPFQTLQWTFDLLCTPYLRDKLGSSVERLASDLLILQQQKLVVNCTGNALTAIHDIRNDGLINDPELRKWGDKVVEECAYIIGARFKSKIESENKSEIDVPKELSLDSLKKQAWHTIEINGKNWSSMVQDMRSKRGATEIDFINGTIVRWAYELGLQAPINEELVRLVKQKTEAQKQ